MICKYVFGSPIETGAVVAQIQESAEDLSWMELEKTKGCIRLSCRMEDSDVVYGLGEQMRGMNKRGFTYVSDALDDAIHTESRHSLYGGHNFLILSRREQSSFGIFVDDPGRVAFDVGETQMDRLEVTAGPDCVVYFIVGESIKDIAKQFRRMIGRSYIPPKWAFGYQQSRWGYINEADVREVVRRHHGQGIPLDAVYLDIDYMEDYKDFTVDKEKFPDLAGLAGEMKEEGVHLVPIIDAGVKIEEGYPVYEEGIEEGYFCKEEDGEAFVGAVWPGKVHFPDVLNSRAREWFGGKYRGLMEQGIDGFWNDMNEPAIFYSEKNLERVMDEILAMRGENLDLHAFFHMKDILLGLSNNPEDYRSFYHDLDGVKVRHDRVHNLYGFYMTRAAAEAFGRIAPDKRTLLFSRSSYIGMHRYGGIWTGDNMSWWSHLLLSVQQMPSLNLCGILYTGSDIGGFGGDATEDLLLRWLEFAIFTPLMRNHAALGTREQEVYQFSHVEAFRRIIRIRYGLLPYLYSEYMKAALEDELYFRPLAFDYPEDAHAVKVEDQLMVGESIMAAPVYVQNATGRYVYLPEDMLLVRMRSLKERTCEVMARGHHYVEMALDEVVFFVKKGHALPLAVLDDDLLSTADLEGAAYEWISFGDGPVEYVLYEDDGISKEYTPREDWKRMTVDGR